MGLIWLLLRRPDIVFLYIDIACRIYKRLEVAVRAAVDAGKIVSQAACAMVCEILSQNYNLG